MLNSSDCIAVAVSGGADSLMSLLLLKEQGKSVLAIHGTFIPATMQTQQELDTKAAILHTLQAQCASLNIPLHIIDLAADFQAQVIHPFVESYLAGNTPNPCAQCNAQIKFGLLMDAAQGLGARYFATGHYAQLVHIHGEVQLLAGMDIRKDQSYFLALVPQQRLQSVLFPLGALSKADIVDELARRNIPIPAPQESQEVCFIAQDDYRIFLQSLPISLPKGGAVLHSETGLTLGAHKGLWQYTEGQRRGLGIAASEALYVIKKDMDTNSLIIGPQEALYSQHCTARQLNLFIDPQNWPEQVFVRTRYRQQVQAAQVHYKDEALQIYFLEAQQISPKGQVAVIYTATRQSEQLQVLAGGILS